MSLWTQTSVSSDATVALGRDIYAKVVFLASKNCVLGDLIQDVFSFSVSMLNDWYNCSALQNSVQLSI